MALFSIQCNRHVNHSDPPIDRIIGCSKMITLLHVTSCVNVYDCLRTLCREKKNLLFDMTLMLRGLKISQIEFAME